MNESMNEDEFENDCQSIVCNHEPIQYVQLTKLSHHLIAA